MKIPEKDVETVLKQELATALYQKGVISLGKASKIAGIFDNYHTTTPIYLFCFYFSYDVLSSQSRATKIN